MEDDVVAVVVDDVIKRVVEHYRQPIHLEAFQDEERTGERDEEIVTTKDDEIEEITSPSDQHVVTSLTLPTILRHHLETLKRAQDDRSDDDIMIRMLISYRKWIRPTLFRKSPTGRHLSAEGVAVLRHYELLLSRFRTEAASSSFDVRNGSLDECRDVLSDLLHDLACDVTVVTGEADTGESMSPPTRGATSPASVRSSRVIATLLRLQHHVLRFSSLYKIRMHNSAVRRCVCTLLAFGAVVSPRGGGGYGSRRSGTVEQDRKRSTFDCRDIDSGLVPTLCNLSRECWIVPMRHSNGTIESVTVLDDDALDGDGVWKSMDIKGNYWDNDNGGDGLITNDSVSKSAVQVWRLLRDQVQEPKDAVEQNQQWNGPRGECFGDEDRVSEWVCSSFFRELDLVEVSKAVRAHFFGRDHATVDATIRTRTRLHMGKTVTEPVESIIKAHHATPSRTFATLRFISLLRMDDLDPSILRELVPVLYELLSANKNEELAAGAAALFHLLRDGKCEDSESRRELWLPYADNLLSLLDLSVKTVRHGPTLAVVGLAQRNLLLALTRPERSCPYSQRRRMATQDWLLVLDRNRHASGDRLIWGVLVGAIVPLLYDHCMQENADALEVGRLGLSALLPLVQPQDPTLEPTGSSSAEETQVRSAALLALSNLLIAAHPIMKRHSGKLLCTLLALAATETVVGLEHDKLRVQQQVLAEHVAAVALHCCDESGESYVLRLQGDTTFDEKLHSVIDRVRKRSEELKATYCAPDEWQDK